MMNVSIKVAVQNTHDFISFYLITNQTNERAGFIDAPAIDVSYLTCWK